MRRQSDRPRRPARRKPYGKIRGRRRACVTQPQNIEEYIKIHVEATKKKYRKEGWTRKNELDFFKKNFIYCPFCGQLADWAINNSEGFKLHIRCDTCLGEFYGALHIKKPEKNKLTVINLGYYNRSRFMQNQQYSWAMLHENAASMAEVGTNL